jgi:hypothetical protein
MGVPPHHGNHALPDFLIIGAQKSATTSLLSYIGQHPGVRLGRKKATHFFDLHFDRGIAAYARNFPSLVPFPLSLISRAAGARSWLTGESCPSYMFLPEVAGRVKATLPAVKLIAILRHPTRRLVSQFQHERRKGRARPQFADYVAISRNMQWPATGEVEWVRQQAAVPRGFYVEQLSHWLNHFPADRLKVLCFEDLRTAPQAVMTEAFAFLGLPDAPVDTSRVLNAGAGAGGSAEAADPALLAELDQLYRTRNRGLEDLAGRNFPWWLR